MSDGPVETLAFCAQETWDWINDQEFVELQGTSSHHILGSRNPPTPIQLCERIRSFYEFKWDVLATIGQFPKKTDQRFVIIDEPTEKAIVDGTTNSLLSFVEKELGHLPITVVFIDTGACDQSNTETSSVVDFAFDPIRGETQQFQQQLDLAFAKIHPTGQLLRNNLWWVVAGGIATFVIAPALADMLGAQLSKSYAILRWSIIGIVLLLFASALKRISRTKR